MRVYLIGLLALALAAGCKDDKKETPSAPGQSSNYTGLRYNAAGSLQINLSHTFNADPLQRNHDYITAAGDTIFLDKLRYYFSNVQLQNEQGAWVNLGNYNLVDIEDEPSQHIALNNVPAGTYSKIRFYVGVDSVANSSGTQEGALSPANDMFWSWSTGYVFFRLKGKYNTTGGMAIDLGGNANLPVIELDLAGFKKEGTSLTLNTRFNLAEVFMNPTLYDLKTMPAAIHSAISDGVKEIRENIEAGVFSVTSVE